MQQLPIKDEGTAEEAYCMERCRHPHGCWTCFHCGARFSNTPKGEREAREHFGAHPEINDPICRIAAGDGSLVATVRRLEAELAAYRADDTELHRQIHRMSADHHQAVRRAEELGYERGLRDAGETEGAMYARKGLDPR